MPYQPPSPPQSTPSSDKRKLRFAPMDQIMNPDEPAVAFDAEDDVPSTPPRKVDPGVQRAPPSPTDSLSSASSSEGPSTPSPVLGRRFVDPKSPFSSFESRHDTVVLNSSLSADASFVWDMARNPQEHFKAFDNSPAAQWMIDAEPLSDLTLTLEGIYEWKIDVAPRGEKPYPTMNDMFVAIYENMSKLVGKDVVDRLHPHTRKRVFAAREARCREFRLNSAEEPLRRVDFLVGTRRFLGVSLSPESQRLVLNVGVLPSRS